jgi:hypothetical protein
MVRRAHSSCAPNSISFFFRASESSLYREGVVTDRVAKDGCCFVNIGLKAECLVKRTIKPGWSLHNLHMHIFQSTGTLSGIV